MAKSWLYNCRACHPSCRPHQLEPWLPSRLLDVGSDNETTIRLVLSASMKQWTQYAALSYRWSSDKSFVLSSTNITGYQETIALSDVSATIRDSVAVTRALGLQYLWIDSMCIIQDDPIDWSREATTMSKVYGLSACTIVAANSGEDSSSCFATRNPHRVRPCRVPNPFKMDSKYSFYIRSQYLHHIHDREIRDSVWYNRGWVFQERTLAPRLLMFSGTQIIWSCEKLQAAETWPCGKTSENYIDRFESFAVERARFHRLLDPLCGVSTSHSAWWDFLQHYMTSAKLTVQSDRLAAIHGVATVVQGLTGQNYCAGFWLNKDLPESLLWKPKQLVLSTPHHSFPPHANQHCAPSWSWAAVEGAVARKFDGFSRETKLITILGSERLSSNKTKPDKAGQQALRVAGMLLPAAMLMSYDGIQCERVATVEHSRKVGGIFDDPFRNGLTFSRFHLKSEMSSESFWSGWMESSGRLVNSW